MIDNALDTSSIIRKIAESTRQFLEQLDANSHEAAIAVRDSFNDKPCAFPKNWCQYASCVLGLRLARVLKRGDIDLCEWKGDGAFESHFWLRIDGYDIDITADQFGTGLPAVLVEAGSKAQEERFPEPRIRPLLARRLCTKPFERALLELDLVVSTQSEAVDSGLAVELFLRSYEEGSDE